MRGRCVPKDEKVFDVHCANERHQEKWINLPTHFFGLVLDSDAYIDTDNWRYVT